MNLFYDASASIGKTITIESSEYAHIAKVLRKKAGDSIQITDGRGNLFLATLQTEGKTMSAMVIELQKSESTPHGLEIAICPTKNNERTEWFVEKAVEIGIGKISLIRAEHSERTTIKRERLERVSIAAMKQSLKLFLPEITDLQTFSDWAKNVTSEIKCIAHCYEGEKLFLKSALQKGKSACIAIGPEGDFSMSEIALAESLEFISVSLGNARLRTETAGIAAAHTYEIINQH